MCSKIKHAQQQLSSLYHKYLIMFGTKTDLKKGTIKLPTLSYNLLQVVPSRLSDHSQLQHFKAGVPES